jgi:hypothetical protein
MKYVTANDGISEHDAELLIHKLIDEETRILAWFTSASGSVVLLVGTLEEFSAEEGVVIRLTVTEGDLDSSLTIPIKDCTLASVIPMGANLRTLGKSGTRSAAPF